MIRMIASASAVALMCGPALADDAAPSSMSAPVAASAPSVWQPEDGDRIRFSVLRKGKDFGTHTVDFDVTDDGSFTATTNVELRAGLGPITMFKYELTSSETWKDGQLVAVRGQTNDDGDKESVSAELKNGQLSVSGTAYEGPAPAGIVASSHWNIHEAYSSALLSTENGEILDTDVTRIGTDVLTIDGQSVEATHYRLVSDLTVDLWYDEQNRWVKLGFKARGQQIDYVLEELY
ncbi:DUF6134 family protein [Henriciella sp. AS95]|uniref:DUF6134 family protein n=1 Tax=Henriciella sp. AS95 TaxID=3135782 RepID=UPI00316D6CD4